jgi:hypothetical protein
MPCLFISPAKPAPTTPPLHTLPNSTPFQEIHTFHQEEKPNITRESTQEVGSRRRGEREEVRKGSSQVEGKAAASAEEVNKLAPLSFPLLPLAPPAISLQIAACVVLAQ